MLKEKQIEEFLAELGIKVEKDMDKVYIDNRLDTSIPLENHYGISIEDGKWSYCFYVLERRNMPEIQIIKEFSNKEEAENYLFLKQLNSYFMEKYIVPSRDYDIENWTIETVRKDMNRLGIPQNYLSYSSERYSNSILYIKEEGLWYSGYVNSKDELMYKTSFGNDDQNWFLSLYANEIYMLYLIDKYSQKIGEKFSDEAILIVVGYK